MDARIETVRHADGDIQRFLTVDGFSWKDLRLGTGPFAPRAIKHLGQLYRVAIIPKDPASFGNLVFFRVPEDLDTAEMPRTIDGFTYYDATANLAAWCAADGCGCAATGLLGEVMARGWWDVEQGTGSGWRPMPVSGRFGYVSDLKDAYPVVCNAHFFLMDAPDAQSPYDLFGTPYGYTVVDGTIVLPPLHHRPALAVDGDGRSRIIHPELREVRVTIDGVTYEHGRNATFYQRPDTGITPREEGTDFLIATDRVLATHHGGGVKVPMGGFVVHVPSRTELRDPAVAYAADAAWRFAIQVGPAIVDDGIAATGFDRCPFHLPSEAVPFPPTVYPLSWDQGRAGRMVLGADGNDRPVLVWAEAAGVLGYERGRESCGASLAEMAAYCAHIGLRNAVNLDGGGSSQLLVEGKRLLHLKDRTPEGKEAERPVPGMLVVER